LYFITRVTYYEIDKSRGMRWAGLCNTHGRTGNAHNSLFGSCDGAEPVARLYVLCERERERELY